MFDRIMAICYLTGGLVLAALLFHARYAAPACDANVVSGAVLNQIKSQSGSDGVYLLDTRALQDSTLQVLMHYFSASRRCEVDVAPIKELQTVDKNHWTRILYSVSRDRKTGKLTVLASTDGLADPKFASASDY
jgi:hypothetical protein